jgi:glycosyltransferase involved in cell wall biosynthesis
VVVNDGSTDRTSRVARDLSVPVLDLPFNLGIGGAVQTGFKYALERGYRAAVQVDADGQHPAEQVGALLEPVLRGEADMVIGSRFVAETGYEGSMQRRAGIAFLSWLCSLAARTRITDATSGFRAYGRVALEYMASYYPADYPEPEAVVLAARRGLRIREMAVAMRERQAGRSSIRGVQPLYYMVKVTVALLVSLIKEGPSSREGGAEG